MPHIVIEYAEPLSAEISGQDLVACVHQAVSICGLFDRNHIKTRAKAYRDFQVGNTDQRFIHTHIRLHRGRTVEQKQSLSKAVVERVAQLELNNVIITAEIEDIASDSYAKLSL